MLQDLNQLAINAKLKCQTYNSKEFKLSDTFKIIFKELNPEINIEFYQFTAKVKTSSDLNIFIPNQWFVLASFFSEYIKELKKYKKNIVVLNLDKNKLSEIRDKKIIDASTELLLNKNFKNEDDNQKIKNFISNYEWWYGYKTIDRNDFYESSILNLAGVVNVTQSYIADLAETLSKNDELINQISNEYNTFYENEKGLKTIILDDKILKNAIFKTFKYCIQIYGEQKVLHGYSINESTIENRKFDGLMIKKHFNTDNLIGLFKERQNVESLKSSNTQRFIENSISILGNEFSYFSTHWNDKDSKNLNLAAFNNYLIDISEGSLEIIKEDGMFILIENKLGIEKIKTIQQTIYFGAPGTGKSYKVDQIIQNLDTKFYQRITFHPEFDNASFVGSYKPVTEKINEKDEITYKYTPQAFTEIYKRAWNDLNNHYYLVIEEINRGNCAEIFGDIFQLLDRNSGYTVSPSNELKKHLVKDLGNEHEGIKNGLKLPSNLSILATMNTSDQSLFPMDSAFKRRWDWEYIPICYEILTDEGEVNASFNYNVEIEDSVSFRWIDFIKSVNEKISNNESLGMDKCIGNYFIKADNESNISLKTFINKAIFYLWNDVFKDEPDSIFEKGVTYEKFFPVNTKGKVELEKILEKLNFKLDTESNKYILE